MAIGEPRGEVRRIQTCPIPWGWIYSLQSCEKMMTVQAISLRYLVMAAQANGYTTPGLACRLGYLGFGLHLFQISTFWGKVGFLKTGCLSGTHFEGHI